MAEYLACSRLRDSRVRKIEKARTRNKSIKRERNLTEERKSGRAAPFSLVRSALQNSVCLLSVYFCWPRLSQILRFAAYSFAVLCSFDVSSPFLKSRAHIFACLSLTPSPNYLKALKQAS